MSEQPEPIKNENPHIVDLVIEDMKERKELGIRRYGTALQAFNGREALQDLYEELQDACIYIKQVLEEKDKEGFKKQLTVLLKEKDVVDLSYFINDAIDELETASEENDNTLAVGIRIGKAISQIQKASDMVKGKTLNNYYDNIS